MLEKNHVKLLSFGWAILELDIFELIHFIAQCAKFDRFRFRLY